MSIILRGLPSLACRNSSRLIYKALITQETCGAYQTTLARYSSLQTFNNMERFIKYKNKWAKKDKVSPEHELIYNAPLEWYMSVMSGGLIFMTAVSVGTFAVGKLMGIDALNFHMSETHPIILASDDMQINLVFALSIFLFFTSRITINRMALRIYKHNQEYIVVYPGFIPGMKIKKYFKSGQVDSVPDHKFISWQDGLYKIDGRKTFLIPERFRSHRDLKELTTDPKKFKELEKMYR